MSWRSTAIIPYCSSPTAGPVTAVNYKMADISGGTTKEEKKKREEKDGKNTLW